MTSFAILLLCIQACLVQNVFGNCVGYKVPTCGCGSLGYGKLSYGNLGYDSLGLGYESGLADSACGSYGGAGIGNVAVAGELPVAGTTVVAGQVPIIGAVEFGGTAGAAGTVSISGHCCGCGCGFGGY